MRGWPGEWELRAQTIESGALESITRGVSCGAAAERAGPACDAGEVAVPTVVEDGGAVGIIGAGLLSGRGPSELPDTKIGHKRR